MNQWLCNLSIHVKHIEEIAQSLDDGKLQSNAVIKRIKKVAQNGDCVAIVLTAFTTPDKAEELTGKQVKFVQYIALVDQAVYTEHPLLFLYGQVKLKKAIAKMIGREEMNI